MTQLDQEIPKIKGSTILSTLDVASGFWTIPVHPDDQHKLAFTFGNRQYTFTRCPFGYANSPAEFNIFLNKACPDARARGNLVYVDDVLMKSSSVEDHLKEINHVLNQLTTAGAKIALHKGQWCKTKVNYVGLLVGRNAIEPQSNRTQAIQSIKTPTNISELRSFLGVCNYSRQFIENYADIAQPLTSLLKKDEPFVWTETQDTAMGQLKPRLCSAPCLAYQTQENNSIWTLDSPIIASAQAYTSSMTKTNEWSLMPAKRCFPQNASTQTAKRRCFALCGLSSVSLITSMHRKSSSRLVISRSPS